MPLRIISNVNRLSIGCLAGTTHDILMVRKLSDRLFAPIIHELPFMMMFYFLLLPNIFTQYTKNDLCLHRFLEPFTCNGVDNSTALLFAYLAACLLYLTRNKILKVMLYALVLVSATIRVFLYISYKMWITSSAIALLKETNANETREFIQSYVVSQQGLIAFGFLIAMTVLIYWLERKRTKMAQWQLSHIKLSNATCGILFLFLCLGVYNLKFYGEILTSKSNEEAGNILDRYGFPYTTRGHNTIMDLLVAIKTLGLSEEEDKSLSEYAIRFSKETPATVSEDSITVVYVLGESYIRRHAHLYGYVLETTPIMDKERAEGRLFVFNDVVAPFNLTYKVEMNTFFCNSMADGERWFQTPFFMQLFKQAGFYVGFFDNQHPAQHQKVEDLGGSRAYNRDIARLSYSAVADHNCEHDGDFVDEIRKMNIPLTAHNLHFYHLMGQHGPANQRFPQSYAKFKASDIKQADPFLNDKSRASIATYDNATLYNDMVMGKIIDMYRDKNAVLVYMSDHGEEMYDYRNSAGRAKADAGKEAQMVRHQFLIPFVIWCSDKYVQQHPQKVKEFQAALDRPFMTDNVAQVIFNLAGLNTKYYHAERDLLSPHFKKRKRIVNDSGSLVRDYDELTGGK